MTDTPIAFIDLQAQRARLGAAIDTAIAKVLDHGRPGQESNIVGQLRCSLQEAQSGLEQAPLPPPTPTPPPNPPPAP